MPEIAVREVVDWFDRAVSLGTTPGVNGWTVKDTSSAGSPTYATAADGTGLALTTVNTSEAEILTLYQNNVKIFTLDQLQYIEFVAQVAGIDAVTTLVMGVASNQDDTPDSVATNAWFRMEGSASTSAVVWETDDAVTDDDDNATGVTLAAVYKKFELDFTRGRSDIRFKVDGVQVGQGSLAGVAGTTPVQPFAQIQKASGTGVPAVKFRKIAYAYRLST